MSDIPTSNTGLENTAGGSESGVPIKNRPRRHWNWRPKLRWFFAEILIVVAGVLIALALNAWWQGRQDAEQERIVLEELNVALANDLQILETQLKAFQSTVRKIDALASHLDREGIYSDSLDGYFGAVYALAIVQVNESPYESLKSLGLGLISSPALRSEVTRLYDLRYKLLEELHMTQRSAVLDVMRPYFLTHFEGLVFGISATPIDYEQLVEDQYFRNVMDYRRRILISSEIPVYEQTIADIVELQNRIESELRR